MTRLEQMLAFLEQDPDDSFSRYAVALEYRSAGQPEKAIEQLEALRARDPSYVATYYQLGQLFAGAGDDAKAEDAYRAGIDVARVADDRHTVSELEAALDELGDRRGEG